LPKDQKEWAEFGIAMVAILAVAIPMKADIWLNVTVKDEWDTKPLNIVTLFILSIPTFLVVMFLQKIKLKNV
jgi:hypothetical protein